jgi:hypothetical protein
MEFGFLICTVLLGGFALLGMVDGVYLHLARYQLHLHPESRWEHLTHTLRALFFPGMLYWLFAGQGELSFWIGLALVLMDLVVTLVDTLLEKDSRSFMGGLPHWEYVLHVFANGLHFAVIASYLAMRVRWDATGFHLADLTGVAHDDLFASLALNLLPGAVLVGLLHVVLLHGRVAAVWGRWTRFMRNPVPDASVG